MHRTRDTIAGKISKRRAGSRIDTRAFRRVVREYYRRHGRAFPWRPPSLKLRRDKTARDQYKILVSEIMLQQTQVSRVERKYQKFLRAFPNFRALDRAPASRVLAVWQGMGYNRRALSLKQIAAKIIKEHRETLPRDSWTLETFPGIGRATAGAILAFAWNEPAVFVETNIRTVFIHHFFKRRHNVSDKEILPQVEATLDRKNPRTWYYALMDYGAYLKREFPNPGRNAASYRKQAPFGGSLREARGGIIRELARTPSMKEKEISKATKIPLKRVRLALSALLREGFITKEKAHFILRN